jgi:hypothetical protein
MGAYGAVLYQIPRDGRVIHDQFGTGCVPDPGGLGRVRDVPTCQKERFDDIIAHPVGQTRLEH